MIVHNLVPDYATSFAWFQIQTAHIVGFFMTMYTFFVNASTQVREAWFRVRQRLLGMFPVEFLNLMFDNFLMENEVIWMMGN